MSDYEGDGIKSSFETEDRARSVGVADFSEQLASGVLRAIDARAQAPRAEGKYRPWIWAGIWVGPFDGGGPFGPGGPAAGGGFDAGGG